MVQIIQNQWWGGWGGWASYTAWTWIEISAQNEISVDTDVVQTVGNMVDNLTWADDDHYPTAKAVADAISWGWLWDVIWPNSSTDWDIALFDWATWKIIKDSWVWLSSKLDASALSNNNYWWAWQGDSTHTPTKWVLYDKIHTMDVEIWNKAADTSVVKLTWNQTINWTKTFWTSPVVPSKTTDATNTWTAIATEAQVYNVAEDVATINSKIPSAATSSNQLADKDYVNDGINSVTAYYITKNAQGDQWATYAELAAATTFYSGWVVRVPTKNDYTIVLADENHDNATTRYIYNSGWEYQYTVNETALTQAQLDALNSWITSWKVSTYDWYASTISWKQDALTLPATPTQWHLVTWWANNKTLADWWAIPTIVYATQAEYTALLPWAESDGKHYFIYHEETVWPRTPWANTVAYYPLNSTDTTSDMKGTGIAYDLTNVGSVTFWTNQWVDCAAFDGTTNSQLYNSSLSFPAMPSQTVLFRAYITWTATYVYQTLYHIWLTPQTWKLWAWFKYDTWLCIGCWYWGYEAIKPWNINWAWHLIANVADWVVGTQYLDGNQYQIVGLNLSDVQQSIYVWWEQSWTGRLTGYMSNLIVENKAWTATEILNYYNQTKSNYWY